MGMALALESRGCCRASRVERLLTPVPDTISSIDGVWVLKAARSEILESSVVSGAGSLLVRKSERKVLFLDSETESTERSA